MGEEQRDVLRLQPHMIPATRTALRSALDQLNEAIIGLSRRGYLAAPWLGDESSSEVAAHYTNRSMDDADSALQALRRYHGELSRTHDTLQRMEDDYRRTEGDNAALWGLRA